MVIHFQFLKIFEIRNTNKSIHDSEKELAEILEIAERANKKVVVYLSMCFGNPYGDPWNVEIVNHWVSKLIDMNVKIISLSDTIGTSNKESIKTIFN